MDPRLKALIEVRDLLKAEGWAPEDDENPLPTVPVRKPRFRTNPLLAVICSAAIATNFILIGANHDLRQGREARIAVAGVRFKGVDEKTDNAIKDLINAYGSKDEKIFVTVNGERVWEGKRIRDLVFERINGISGPHSVAIDGKGLLQVWVYVEGRGLLLGQSNIVLDKAYASESEIDVPIHLSKDDIKDHLDCFVKLRVH